MSTFSKATETTTSFDAFELLSRSTENRKEKKNFFLFFFVSPKRKTLNFFRFCRNAKKSRRSEFSRRLDRRFRRSKFGQLCRSELFRLIWSTTKTKNFFSNGWKIRWDRTANRFDSVSFGWFSARRVENIWSTEKNFPSKEKTDKFSRGVFTVPEWRVHSPKRGPKSLDRRSWLLRSFRTWRWRFVRDFAPEFRLGSNRIEKISFGKICEVLFEEKEKRIQWENGNDSSFERVEICFSYRNLKWSDRCFSPKWPCKMNRVSPVSARRIHRSANENVENGFVSTS